jgi:fumarate reductase subunit C
MTTHVSSEIQMEKKQIHRENLLEAIVVGIFSVSMFIVTFTFEEVPAILAQGISPVFFPRTILAIMFLLSLILGIKAVKPSAESMVGYKRKKSIPKIVYITAAALLLFVVGLFTIGTIPSLFAFCLLLSYLWGERRYLAMLITFSIFAASVYVLFGLVLGVNLP